MIRDQLFRGVDIYSGFSATPDQVDMQGWGSTHRVFEACISAIKPRLIIEVGSWKGASAIHMATCLKNHEIDGEIVCVDTWLGSPEHWLGRGPKAAWYQSLKHLHGYPSLYYTFLNNVVANQVDRYITPLPVPSSTAFFILRELGAKASMIYIDAGHEYESVREDLGFYYQLLADDGVLILDDYVRWPGVTRAAHEFALQHKLSLHGEPGKAVISRHPSFRPGTRLTF